MALVAIALAIVAHFGRRATIRAFFQDGAGDVFLPQPREGAGLERVDHVRVVVLDGLSLEMADTLPGLTRLCGGGLALTVDNGFPTVSLPVQHVLWTGLTQQQTGLWYRIPRLEHPPEGGIPARISDSRGIAESHPDIVGSFGFSMAEPAAGETWEAREFVEAANEAIASDAALVFVHVLRIDEAGHERGGASQQYRDAAAWADARLVEWVERGPVGARWFVLADHGHLPGGGHGGAEDEIRLVRACIAGPLPEKLADTGAIHLVDLSRAVAESLGIDLSPASGGRPLAAAMADPEPEATLPVPSNLRWSLATLALALGLGIARWVAGRGMVWAPWWLVASYASLVLAHGWPSLSQPVIYPPYGTGLLLAAAPGFVLLAASGWWASSRWAPWRFAVAQLSPVVALALAFGVLCGAPQALMGMTSTPPLMPTWTAHTSFALSLGLGGALTLAGLSVAVAAVGRGVRREPT